MMFISLYTPAIDVQQQQQQPVNEYQNGIVNPIPNGGLQHLEKVGFHGKHHEKPIDNKERHNFSSPFNLGINGRTSLDTDFDFLLDDDLISYFGCSSMVDSIDVQQQQQPVNEYQNGMVNPIPNGGLQLLEKDWFHNEHHERPIDNQFETSINSLSLDHGGFSSPFNLGIDRTTSLDPEFDFLLDDDLISYFGCSSIVASIDLQQQQQPVNEYQIGMVNPISNGGLQHLEKDGFHNEHHERPVDNQFTTSINSLSLDYGGFSSPFNLGIDRTTSLAQDFDFLLDDDLISYFGA